MAITQPIGNIRAMPQTIEGVDPLLGMKAFAAGTQLGQELAGLSLASDRLRFEKAQLKAKEEGLKLEQSLAQFKLNALGAEVEERQARARSFNAEAAQRERELALSRADLAGIAAAQLLGEAEVPAPAVGTQPLLAGATVGAEQEEIPAEEAAVEQPAMEFKIPEVGAAAAAPAGSFRYQPRFATPGQDPMMQFGTPDPEATANAAIAQRRLQKTNDFLSRLRLTQATSPADARKLFATMPEFQAELRGLRPERSTLITRDANNLPVRYEVFKDDAGNVLSVLGEPSIDVETLYKERPAQKKVDEVFAEDFGKSTISAPKLQENIQLLNEARRILNSTDWATGPLVSILPEALSSRIPGIREGTKAQTAIEQVVAQSLREILGGQFAMREGDRLLQRSFDVRLEEADNVKRLDSLLATLTADAQAAGAQRLYFQENGTLAGYGGPSAGDIRQRVSAALGAPAPASPSGKSADDEVERAFSDYLSGFLPPPKR